MSLKLLEQFPKLQVHCLCGGLVAWFNEGHMLEDADGMPSAALHPHSDALQRFVTRENEYAES